MYKVAILGCENSHADHFLQVVLKDRAVTDVEFVGVYSEDLQAAQKLHEKYGVPVASAYDEFVGKVDGLIITARHGDNHYRHAQPYLESGIPMFIDKPITCTEEDAKAFADALKAHNIAVSGGSCCALTDHVQKLKKAVTEGTYDSVYGGYLRAPIQMDSPHGGYFFYAQHLTQVATEIFGYYPKTVKVVNNGNTYTCTLRYEAYDVTLCYVKDNYQYYAMISCEKDSVGGVYTPDDGLQREFAEFYELLQGKASNRRYEDFFAPVYVNNAIYRAMQSGNEEPVHRYGV